jgi:hypothetical protein
MVLNEVWISFCGGCRSEPKRVGSSAGATSDQPKIPSNCSGCSGICCNGIRVDAHDVEDQSFGVGEVLTGLD